MFFLREDLSLPAADQCHNRWDEGEKINRSLARAALSMGIPMAVGSQAAALESEKLKATYQVVRKENPEGFLIANLSAGVTPENAFQAVEMLQADALQLHLNIPQEVMMSPEGDSCFRGYLQNIRRIAASLPVLLLSRRSVSA